MQKKFPRRRRVSTGAKRGSRCTTTFAVFRRLLAHGSIFKGRVSRHCGRQEARGAPGTVLDGKLTIACGDGAVRLMEVQRAGKQPMSAGDFLRGTPVKAG